jgi:hypothetical protein
MVFIENSLQSVEVIRQNIPNFLRSFFKERYYLNQDITLLGR